MGLQKIQDELVKQMGHHKLTFNVESESELREVIEETSEYIQETYSGNDISMVAEYLRETMENYPEHIERIREYIEPVMKIRVSEIFFSLQGEGSRAGTPNVFIRLQGCKTKDACYASGIRCDTEFESGREMDVTEIRDHIVQIAGVTPNIIWTGGEPAQQLTSEIVAWFKDKGFYQAIETSGLFPVPEGLDHVCVSPKVAEHVVAKNFPNGVDELRYVRHAGQVIPQPGVVAHEYFISPHSDGDQLNKENLAHCIELVKQNPKWKLSLQMHKIWQVL